MRVRLDDTWCDIATDDVATALAEAAGLAEEQGRIVVDIHADGSRWGNGELADTDKLPVPDELHLTTEVREDAACQALDDADAALVVAGELQRAAAELLETDQVQQAMGKLSEAISIWSDVERAVQLTVAVTGVGLDEIAVGGQSAETTIGRLGERLRMMVESLHARDSIGLSDTLQYELPEVVQEWRDLLQAIGRQVRRGEG